MIEDIALTVIAGSVSGFSIYAFVMMLSPESTTTAVVLDFLVTVFVALKAWYFLQENRVDDES